MKAAAEQLLIHYQTLLFRKQRIEKFLGGSFDDFVAQMSLLTALDLLKLRGKQKRSVIPAGDRPARSRGQTLYLIRLLCQVAQFP